MEHLLVIKDETDIEKAVYTALHLQTIKFQQIRPTLNPYSCIRNQYEYYQIC